MSADELKTEDFLSTARNFFKYNTLGILFVLIIAQCVDAFLKIKIIPPIISISVAFICIFYLWLAARKDIEILEEINLDLLRARDNLRMSHVDTILSLVLSQEAKDAYTYGHSERVKHYSMLIAQKMGLAQEDIEMIGRGAKLHDIGKIGIRDDVLFSDGKLTDEQFDIIKSHPLKGVTILEPLKFLRQERLVVRNHHERYDGKGYPDGLKGEEIPMGARIVCVADTFDAMRTKRLYRDPLTKEAIIVQFTTNSGTQFDPKVVNAFIAIIDTLFA